MIEFNDLNFQSIPYQYETIKNQIRNELVQNLYDEFTFYHLFISNYTNDHVKTNENFQNLQDRLFNYLKDFKFITYHFSENIINANQSDNNKIIYESNTLSNAIICVEGKCLIIESIDISYINNVMNKLKEKGCLIINADVSSSNKIDSNIKDEIVSIYNYYQQNEISQNNFVEYTIFSIACYIIRRNFYPTSFFKDTSFFIYDKSKISKEQILKEILMKILSSKTDDEMIKYHNMFIEKLYNSSEDEEISIQDFCEDEFIILRTIYSIKKASLYLVIHLKSLHIFAMKKIHEEIEHEISFCSKYSHRCLTHFYGFLKDNGEITGLIYEYMCNDTLYSLISSNKERISENFVLITTIRLLQAIGYLHSNSLIHRDIKSLNILIDHDFFPYLSDFETIRHIINEEDQSINLTMTCDIGSLSFSSTEQLSNENYSFPTDIYSFGLIIYCLIEKDNDFDRNKKLIMTKGSNLFHKIYELCTKDNEKERITYKELKELIICKINSLNDLDLYDTINNDQAQIAQFVLECILIQKNNEENVSQILRKLLEFKNFLSSNDEEKRLIILGGHYYSKKEYLKAKKFFKLAAKFNNSDALTYLGILYLFGNGVKKNYIKSQYYFELAAKQNNQTALQYLGYIYENGLGVSTNFFEAKKYYELLEKHNNSSVINSLGILYFHGYGTVKDYQKAKKLFEISAKQDYSYAILNLGNMYYKGEGVNKDYKKAKKYYEKAAQLKNPFALYKLGKFYYHGYGVQQDYLKARQYYKLSANLNDSFSLQKLGKIYYYGYGVNKDFLKAKKYFELAAQLNNSSALYYLGYLCSTDIEFGFNISKAIKYLHKCIKIHKETCIIPDYVSNFYVNIKIYNRYYYHSNNYLGLIYLTYYNDIEKANEYIKEAAFGEYAYGQNNYGLFNQFYFDNIENAKHFFEKASKNQFALADYNLGYIYEKENKIEKSIVHYIKASNNEDNQLMYQKYHYKDKYFEASKTFIICYTNLKLTNYFYFRSKFNESKKYFVRAFAKILSISNYKFQITINEKEENSEIIFSYINRYILNSPLFNLVNQPNLSINMKTYLKNLENENNNNLTYSKKDIKKQYQDYIEIQNVNDNQNKITFEYPEKLFEYILSRKTLKEKFYGQIQNLLTTLKSIIYTPPYHILFGRINIHKPIEQKNKISNPFMNINCFFYEGFEN